MVINFENKTYCCNCDWLQFSVHTDEVENPEIACPEGYDLSVYPGNNIFKHRAILSRVSDGAKMLTLLWGPHSKVLASNLMTVQVSNWMLYQNGIRESVRLLKRIVPCAYNNIGRLDVCLDFEAGKAEMAFIRQLWLNEIYVQGKSEGSLFWHRANDEAKEGRFPHCLSWGSKNTEIKVKLYNKSREVGIGSEDGVEKQYIVSGWQSAGFDIERVWRLEFSMNTSGQLCLDGKRLCLDDVCSDIRLYDMFRSLYRSRFICRRNYGFRQGHHNRDPIVWLLDVPPSSIVVGWGGSEMPPTICPESIVALRRCMSLLDDGLALVSSSFFEDIASAVLRLCSDRSVDAYFRAHWGGAPLEVLQGLYEETGGGIVERDARPSRMVL